MRLSCVVRHSVVTGQLALLAACGAELAAPNRGTGNLEIQTVSSISAADLGSAGIEATVRNATTQIFYTNIGDAFNSADEQDPLVTSLGSDGVVEVRSTSGDWMSITIGVMVEGTKYVALKPGKTYRLIGSASPGSYRGQARIRLRYGDTPSSSGSQFLGYSNTFEIR